MKFISFKDYLEEMASGEVGKFLMRSGINSKAVENPLTRQTINAQLAKTVGHPFLTPYIALGAVQRILAYASIVIPQYVFLDKEQGEVIFDVNQFGRVDGINLDGSKVVDELADKYYVFFAYEMNDEGTFDVIAQLVNSAELQALMDVEEDVDEDLAEEPMCADDGKKGKLLLEPEEDKK